MNLDEPFRGSEAVAAGVVTVDRLRGPRFRRLAPDVHVAATTAPTLRQLLWGLRLWRPDAVVGGLAAAARWCRLDAAIARASDGTGFVWPGVGLIGTVDVVVTSSARAPAGVRVRRDVLAADEVTVEAGLRLTSPARTVLDVLGAEPRDTAIVAGDAVARRCGLAVDDVEQSLVRHRGARGSAWARRFVPMLEPRCRTPFVSRVRLALGDRGIGVTEVGLLVTAAGHPVGPADLAWPSHRTAALCGDRGDGPPPVLIAERLRAIGWSACLVTEHRLDAARLGADEICALLRRNSPTARRARTALR